jgi:erythromycin esterase
MRALRDAVRPVDELFADGQPVLRGEATHGTHEFYKVRAALTRRLIAERGLGGVAGRGRT